MLRSLGRWKDDGETSSCDACGASFGVFRRRHHCRSCGGIFCAACATHSLIITAIDRKRPQRVCSLCYGRLREPATARQSAATTITRSVPEPKTSTMSAAKATPKSPSHQEANDGRRNAGSRSGETDSEHPKEQQDERRTGPALPHNRDELDSGSSSGSSDGCMRPPTIDLNSISSMPQSQHSVTLSFLSALQDSLKQRDADNVVSVVIYAGEGKQQSLVTDVRDGETMQDLASRLAPLYFRLQHPPFRRMDDEALRTLREELRFSTEHQVIAPATPADEVAQHCKKLVLSTLHFSALQELFLSTASGKSVRSFLRSGHNSERVADAAFGSERFDD